MQVTFDLYHRKRRSFSQVADIYVLVELPPVGENILQLFIVIRSNFEWDVHM